MQDSPNQILKYLVQQQNLLNQGSDPRFDMPRQIGGNAPQVTPITSSKSPSQAYLETQLQDAGLSREELSKNLDQFYR